MSNYQKVKLNILQSQTDKIKKAIQEKSDVSIRLSHSDLEGEHILALTKSQLNKIAKAYHNGTGVTLKLSKKQIEYNSKVEGGFLGYVICIRTLPNLARLFPFLALATCANSSSPLPNLA